MTEDNFLLLAAVIFYGSGMDFSVEYKKKTNHYDWSFLSIRIRNYLLFCKQQSLCIKVYFAVAVLENCERKLVSACCKVSNCCK